LDTLASVLVLLVDDLEDSRAMYAEYLARSGCRVVEAGDGRRAIAVAHERLPDVVVIDLSLPVVDGCAAIRLLKGDGETASIPVIVLTGHATLRDAKRAKDAGCDAFLVKPCLPSALLALVRKLTAPPASDPR
jgi:CheY-like chemotaxis protein